MASKAPDCDTIFCDAIEIASREERAAFVARACGDNVDVRQRVEKLVNAHFRAGSFLETASEALSASGVSDRPDVRVHSTIDTSGAVLGPYKLLEQIGEGGMGVVYMAEQDKPIRRKVAVKIIKPGMDSRQVIARFEAERQALALMDHVNIARVFDGGATENGRPYFVMELVHGVPITKYCDDNRLTPRERLELFVPVCQAIQHAHQKGIIHRDIKPSNVMVRLYEGKPAAKVIDFGVAKATEQKLTDKTLFTQYGAMVGTLEYMSPEQAEMSALGVDTRSDIYSLGVLLYELLTGSTPLTRKRVREAAYPEVLRMIREEEPPKPSTRLSDSGEALATISLQRHTEPAKLAKVMRGELDWIVMKCLEKNRNRRYETVNGFAADVQRYLDDEPVQACPPSVWYRFRKFARRNTRVLATAAITTLAVLMAVVALAVSNILITRESAQKAQALVDKDSALKTAKANEDDAKAKAVLAVQSAAKAKKERDRFAKEKVTARRNLYFAKLTLAQHAYEAGQIPRVVQLLEEQRPDFDELDFRGFEWYHLWRKCNLGFRLRLKENWVSSLLFSSDGKTLISAGWGKVVFWDPVTGQALDKISVHTANVISAVISPDGNTLVCGCADGVVKIWDVPGRKERAGHKAHQGWVRLALSPDGNTLASTDGSRVKLWQLPTGEFLSEIDEPARTMGFTRDGKFATISQGLKFWNSTTGKLLPESKQFKLRLPWNSVSAMCFSQDLKNLAARQDDAVVVWDLASGRKEAEFKEMKGGTNILSFSPNGDLLAFGNSDHSVGVWEPASGRHWVRYHSSPLRTLTFSPNGKTLVSACGREIVKVWDIPEHLEPDTLHQKSGRVLAVAVSPDGRTLASASHEIKHWDLARDKQIAMLGPQTPAYNSVAFSPDGKTLAAGTHDGTLRLWDLARQQIQYTQKVHSKALVGLSFSPDGQLLATASWGDSFVPILERGTGKIVATLKHDFGVRTVKFSPDGQILATGTDNGRVFLWQVSTGKKLPFDHGKWGWGEPTLAFSADGKTLAVGTAYGVVWIVDMATRKLTAALQGKTGAITALTFFPDGRTLAAASQHNSIKVWDVANKLERLTLSGHNQFVGTLACTPDGRTLISGSFDGTVKLWRMATKEEVLAQSDLPSSADYRWALDAGLRKLLGLEDGQTGTKVVSAFPNKTWQEYELAAEILAGKMAQVPNDPSFFESERKELTRAYAQRIKQLLQEAVSRCPDETRAQNNIAWRLVAHPNPLRRNTDLALKMAKKLVAKEPHNGLFLRTLGAAHYRARDWKAASDSLTKAIVLENGADVSFCPFMLAMAHWKQGERGKAQTWYSAGLVWLEKTGRKDLEQVGLRTEAALLLGLPEGLNAEQKLAKEDYVRYFTLLMGAAPEAPWIYHSRGQKYAWAKRWPEAEADYRKAIALGEKLAKQCQHASAVAAVSLKVQLSLGRLLVATGRLDEAQKIYEHAVTLSYATCDPLEGRWWFERELAGSYNYLGTHLIASGRMEQAEKLYQRRIEIYEKLVAGPPPTAVNWLAKFAFRLTSTYVSLADLLVAANRPEEAEAVYHRGQAYLNERAVKRPELEYRQELARVQNWHGIFLAGQGLFPEAEQAHRTAHQIYHELVQAAAAPGDHTHRRELFWTKANLAEALLNLDRREEASQMLRQALDLANDLHAEQPKRGYHDWAANICNQLAWFLATCADPKLRDPRQAVEMGKKAVTLAPSKGIYLTALGAAHYRSGDCQAAIESLRKVNQWHNGRPFTVNAFFLAMSYWQLGEKDQARKWYTLGVVWSHKHASEDEELRRFESESRALLQLPAGLSPEQEQAKTDDVNYFSLAVEMNPQVAWVYEERGRAYIQSKQWDKSIADFSKAIELEPERWWAWAYRAAGRGYSKQFDQALTDYTKAIELGGNRDWVWRRRGQTYGYLRRWKEALADYNKAIELAPGHAESWNLRGIAYSRAGQQEKALSDYAKAGELKPSAVYCGNQGSVCVELKLYDKAIAHYSNAIKLEPGNANYWNRRGVAHSRLGQKEKALSDFAKAGELNPDVDLYWRNQGSVCAEMKQHKTAITHFSKAIKLNAVDESNWRYRGNAFAELGQWEKASADFAKAVALKGDVPYSHYRLALVHLQRGQHEEYRKVCADMVKRCDLKATPVFIHQTTWTCVLRPDAVSDWKPLVKLAEQSLAADRKNYDKLYFLGAVLYRASRFAEAAKSLSEADAAYKDAMSVRSSIAYNWLFQAMTQHRLGHHGEASVWLEKALKAIEQPAGKSQDATASVWNRRLTLQLLRREAEQLLDKKVNE